MMDVVTMGLERRDARQRTVRRRAPSTLVGSHERPFPGPLP